MTAASFVNYYFNGLYESTNDHYLSESNVPETFFKKNYYGNLILMELPKVTIVKRLGKKTTIICICIAPCIKASTTKTTIENYRSF